MTKVFGTYEEINMKMIIFTDWILSKSYKNMCNILKTNSAYVIRGWDLLQFYRVILKIKWLDELMHAKYPKQHIGRISVFFLF